jgi:hypothetical protein
MDLILYENHLTGFAIRPANLPHSEWQAIAAEIRLGASRSSKSLKCGTLQTAIPLRST